VPRMEKEVRQEQKTTGERSIGHIGDGGLSWDFDFMFHWALLSLIWTLLYVKIIHVNSLGDGDVKRGLQDSYTTYTTCRILVLHLGLSSCLVRVLGYVRWTIVMLRR